MNMPPMEIIILLLWILVAVLILGAIYWVAERFLPHPFAIVLVGVIALVLLIVLLGSADSSGLKLGD
jgi:hypothetical protein